MVYPMQVLVFSDIPCGTKYLFIPVGVNNHEKIKQKTKE